MRIAIAGFQHETNTFVSEPTDFAAFEQADSWPELLSGQAVIDQTRGMNLPIAGFVQAAEEDADFHPILWGSAEPGGPVTDHAFDTITGRMTDSLAQMTSLDAVYLDLHGAMVTQSHDDGEGALLAFVRDVIGADIPLVISLDLHANLTQQMVDLTDAITVYRTYPHIDMADTGARAWRMLEQIMTKGRPAKAWRQADFLVPLHAQHTGADPARALYRMAAAVDDTGTARSELALGFTASDIHDAGPSVLAYADTQDEADAIATGLADALATSRDTFNTDLQSATDAVAQALDSPLGQPVVIADVQDNPGAGASSDTTGLLRALIQHNASNSMLGLIHDPNLAKNAHAHGVGASFDAQIGGQSPMDSPLNSAVRVRHLSDGYCVYTGEMYGGGVCTLGLSAALEIVGQDITFIVTSVRNQCLDLAHFHHFELDPSTARIVCVKSTAHFRADFEPIAQQVLVAEAPGQFPCVLQAKHYKKLRPSVRQWLASA